MRLRTATRAASTIKTANLHFFSLKAVALLFFFDNFALILYEYQ